MPTTIPPLMIQKFSLVSIYDDATDTKNPVVLLQVSRRSNLSKWLETTEAVAYADITHIQQSRDSESIQLTLEVEVAEVKKQYRIRVPFAWLRTAELFISHSEFPMFVIAPDDIEYSATVVYAVTDFDCIVLAPDEEDEQGEEIESIISEHITGKPDMGVSLAEFNETRSTVMEIVMNLINGDPRALVSAYSFVNPYNQLEAASKKSTWKPVLAEKKLSLIKAHLSRLLIATNPASLSGELLDSDDQEEHEQVITTFEQLMSENGLTDLFSESMPHAKPDVTNPQDQVAYLAKPVTLLPQKMSALEGKLQDLPSIRKPWQSAHKEEDMISNGDDLAAAFVVVATRLARLEELKIKDHIQIHPMIVLGHGMTNPGEPMSWVVQEALKLLATKHFLPFNDLLESELNDAQNLEEKINSVFGYLLHRFGHKLLEEAWEKDSLRIALRNQPLMATFVEEVYEQEQAANLDPDSHDQETPCSVINAVFNLLRLGFQDSDMVDQLGHALIAIADLNAVKDNFSQANDYQQGSPEWTQYVQSYLADLLETEE